MGNGDEKDSGFFIMYRESIKTLQDEMIAIVGLALARSIMFRYGFKCGNMSAREMGLGGQGRAHMVEYFTEIWMEIGLARPSSIKQKDSDLIITLKETLESTHSGRGCDFTRGYLAGMMTSISGTSYYCSETKCVSSGDKSCVFLLSEEKKAKGG
jgi:predicted hydrocarbon binding protein